MQSGMNLADECKAAGANDFLLKPYMPDTLIGSIKQGLTNRHS
jgi:FixJ family two-component response regulator